MSNQLQQISALLSGTVGAASPSVVSVHSHKARSSGFVWRPGLIVTADDALADNGEIRVVLADGNEAVAQIAGRDPSTDVALLRVEKTDAPAIELATSIPAAGSLAVLVAANGGSPAAALGMVAVSGGAWQSMRGGDIDARIELDVRLRRSSEGGVAIDANGQAFGMVVAGPRRRALVIPSATIERTASKLEKNGRVPRGYLGLGLHPVTVDGLRTVGLMVMSVDQDGPGARSGIHQGDVLVSWDGKPVARLPILMRSLGPDSVGKTVAVELRRGGATQKADLIVGERPAA